MDFVAVVMTPGARDPESQERLQSDDPNICWEAPMGVSRKGMCLYGFRGFLFEVPFCGIAFRPRVASYCGKLCRGS